MTTEPPTQLCAAVLTGRMQQKSMSNDALNVAVPVHRVLVVEDEFLIRFVLADHLRDAGFAVVEAANGDEAIDLLGAGVAVDLVFTDVRMPGEADGLAVLAYVKSNRPELPVIITSAHLEPKVALVGGAAGFLAKPCDLDKIVATLRTALSAA